MTDPTWRAHPVYSGYEASSDGRVRSIDRWVAGRWGPTLRRGLILKTSIRRNGYLGGNVSVDGRRINFDVHRFVCEAFHGLPERGDLEVRRLDGDRTNNQPRNLVWGTPSQNQLDVVRHGRHAEVNRTCCPVGHPYIESNTRLRRGKRECIACTREHDRARQPRRTQVARQRRARMEVSDGRGDATAASTDALLG